MTDGAQDLVLLCGGNDRIEHLAFFALIAADAPEKSGVMVGQRTNGFINFVRFIGDNEERRLLVIFIQHFRGLGRCKLENNRIQGFVPTEKNPGCGENDNVEGENVIPGIGTAALCNKNRDEIRSSASRSGIKAKANGNRANKASENSGKKQVVGDVECWQGICENAGKQNHLAGKEGVFFTDEKETRDSGNRVQDDESEGERQMDVDEFFCTFLQKQSQSGKAAGEEIRGFDKSIQVESHQQCRSDNAEWTPKQIARLKRLVGGEIFFRHKGDIENFLLKTHFFERMRLGRNWSGRIFIVLCILIISPVAFKKEMDALGGNCYEKCGRIRMGFREFCPETFCSATIPPARNLEKKLFTNKKETHNDSTNERKI